MSAGQNNRCSSVSYDACGVFIHEQPVFLISGSMHYFRVPREEWRERMEMALQYGLNCMETYVAWNVHETREGVYNFTGQADLEAFLELAQSYGLYVILRPGPYICAEWDYGGFPSWFLQKKGIHPRRLNGPYMFYVKQWLNVLLPKIKAHLITNGGNVIMVQVENELSNIHLTTEHEKAYMRELVTSFHRNGINVPLISCEGGLEGALECINAYDPATRFQEYRSKYPEIPLIAMELWSDWYLTWDREHPENERQPEVTEHAIWKSIAHGGAGYNLYMWHGGTNFAYSAMYLQTTSYFDGAPLNENGIFNDNGRCTRRVSLFVQASQQLLAGSIPCSPPDEMVAPIRHRTIKGNQTLQPFDWSHHGKVPFASVAYDGKNDLACWSRTNGKGGSIIFVENLTDRATNAELDLNGEQVMIPLQGYQIAPVLLQFPCRKPFLIEWLSSRLCTRQIFGDSEWIVLAGAADTDGAFLLNSEDEVSIEITGVIEYQVIADKYKVEFSFRQEPSYICFISGKRKLFVAVVEEQLADRIWFFEQSFLLGPHHVWRTNETWELWLQPGKQELYWADEKSLRPITTAPVPLPKLPVVDEWQIANGIPEAGIDYDDTSWISMWEPEEMTQLGCHYGYGWYRTIVVSDIVGDAYLHFSAYADRILLYVNGSFAGVSPCPAEDRLEHPSWGATVRLNKGRNTIAVLTDNLGKVKGDWQLGMISMDHEKKGIFGAVSMNWNARRPIHNWKFRSALAVESSPEPVPYWDQAKAEQFIWTELHTSGQSLGLGTIFKGKFNFPESNREACRYLKMRLTSMTKGVIWVNGHHLGRYWTVNGQTDYVVPQHVLQEYNEVCLFEELRGDITHVKLVYNEELNEALKSTFKASNES